MATQGLTKPQVRMLTKAMRDGAAFGGRQYATARNLRDRGFATITDGGTLYPTTAGLLALKDYRRTVYANYGSMASMLDMEEVEAALAQVQA